MERLVSWTALKLRTFFIKTPLWEWKGKNNDKGLYQEYIRNSKNQEKERPKEKWARLYQAHHKREYLENEQTFERVLKLSHQWSTN